jgi:hypothetical protein
MRCESTHRIAGTVCHCLAGSIDPIVSRYGSSVPRAWLKSFGDSKRPIRNDWTNEFLRDPLQPLALMTGPAKRHTPPTMRPGD